MQIVAIRNGSFVEGIGVSEVSIRASLSGRVCPFGRSRQALGGAPKVARAARRFAPDLKVRPPKRFGCDCVV